MKKKSILFLCLIGLASFMSCSDKSSAEFEVSLEGQLVKTDVNKGKWPKWMFGDDICSWDRNWNIYLSKLTRTEWQKAEKVLVHGHLFKQTDKDRMAESREGIGPRTWAE